MLTETLQPEAFRFLRRARCFQRAGRKVGFDGITQSRRMMFAGIASASTVS